MGNAIYQANRNIDDRGALAYNNKQVARDSDGPNLSGRCFDNVAEVQTISV